MALLLACLSFVPSLIPRPATLQGVLTGVTAAIGYGLGVFGAWLWRALADRDTRSARPGHWRAVRMVAAVTLGSALILGLRWYRQGALLVHIDPESPLLAIAVLPIAATIFLIILGIGRGVRAASRFVGRRLEQVMGPRPARVLGALVVISFVALLFNGVIFERVTQSVNAAFSLADAGTPEGLSAPRSPLRSGGPESQIPWDSLGFQGRAFVAQGPNASQIRAVAGRAGPPAQATIDPIRVYSGLSTAEDVEDRAARAVQDLERAGGFERSELLIVTTTGSGWVEPTAVASFEHLTYGDSATVAMQYSYLPSPLSFLGDPDRATDAGRALFDAVYDRWSRLPADKRPRLWACGESLGSFGGERAFSGEFDMRNRLSGAVFTGPPSFNTHYRYFVDHRDPGTTQIEPVYRHGRIVRFTIDPRRPAAPADQPWEGSRVLYMQHPSDGITWWSTDLLFFRPDWLAEPRGPDVLPQIQWIPVVTFWQVAVDMAIALDPPPGFGHNFNGEHVDAWAQVLRVPDWTRQRSQTLRQDVQAHSLEAFTPSS